MERLKNLSILLGIVASVFTILSVVFPGAFGDFWSALGTPKISGSAQGMARIAIWIAGILTAILLIVIVWYAGFVATRGIRSQFHRLDPDEFMFENSYRSSVRNLQFRSVVGGLCLFVAFCAGVLYAVMIATGNPGAVEPTVFYVIGWSLAIWAAFVFYG
jgi:hypothetical protein